MVAYLERTDGNAEFHQIVDFLTFITIHCALTVGDEAVYTGDDGRVVRAATTAASLEAEQETGNINKTQPIATLNEPSPRGTGSVLHDVEEEPRRATPPPTLQSQEKERKRSFAAQRAEQIINKPPTKAQLRNKMVTYLKHMGKYTHNQLKSKSFKKIQMLYEREQKWINDFVPMDSEEKLEDDDAEKEELRAYFDIVPVDDIDINVESS
nr:hypothetical protein [Tanacetum cinerariifolium]